MGGRGEAKGPESGSSRLRPWAGQWHRSRVVGLVLFLGFFAVLTVVAVVTRQSSADPPVADVRNSRSFQQDNLWSSPVAQTAVWIDEVGAPILGRRATGGNDWDETDLSLVAGNPLSTPTIDDSHAVYVVAEDPLGHIHVAGNMFVSEMRYIRTARPGDTSEWISPVVGGGGDPVTYPRFVGLPDGTLLFFRRERQSQTGGSVWVDRLDAGTTQWQPLGPVIDGEPSGERVYLHRVAVDPRDGSIHLFFVWRNGRGERANVDMSYARSDDGGRTWVTSEGRPLPLPITHDSAEVVLDTPATDGWLTNQGGAVVDAAGRPHAITTVGPERQQNHVWFDGERWHRRSVDLGLTGRPRLVRGPAGSVWAVGRRGNQMRAVELGGGGGGVSGPRVAVVWEGNPDGPAHQFDDTVAFLLVDDSGPPRVEVLDLGS